LRSKSRREENKVRKEEGESVCYGKGKDMVTGTLPVE
jgi:hypothetical protein